MLSKNYFVDKIGYFGSYARNEQNEFSDIDILISFKKQLRHIILNNVKYIGSMLFCMGNNKIGLKTI